jgi:low affinity Fe/Cu permease
MGHRGVVDMNEFFRKFARAIAEVLGSAWAFVIAIAVIAIWLVSGPAFHFSDTWQLVMNTFTSIVTFLMVFIIQNSQNRDAKAIHLKLDELLRAVDTARTNMVDLEHRPDKELAELQTEFLEMRQDQVEEIGEKLDDLHEDVQEHLEEHGEATPGHENRPAQAGNRTNSH